MDCTSSVFPTDYRLERNNFYVPQYISSERAAGIMQGFYLHLLWEIVCIKSVWNCTENMSPVYCILQYFDV